MFSHYRAPLHCIYLAFYKLISNIKRTRARSARVHYDDVMGVDFSLGLIEFSFPCVTISSLTN